MTHTVVRGDTLGAIARRHRVTVRQIRRWNRLRGDGIRRGQNLVIYSMIPRRPTRVIEHTVVRGDSCNRIARHYAQRHSGGSATSRRAVRRSMTRLNRRLRCRRIQPGQVIRLEVIGPENPSRAVGRTNRGTLVNGERLVDGPGYTLMKPYVWGTNEVITHLLNCLPMVRRQRRWRTAPDVVVGDISRRGGGFLSPHRSHQNGLDVDIGYYLKTRPHPRIFRNVTSRTLDREKTWRLLKCFLETDQVEMIFMDHQVQRWMYDYVRTRPGWRRRASELFQYPRSRTRHRGLIRHSSGHRNHFHIRFKNVDSNDD
jgi:murein endopeptidase